MNKTIYVGIGASAGGLEPLQKLVALLPQNGDYVYILAQHLTPDKKSFLSTILTRHTTLPVLEITHDTKFLPNHLYIIPPQCNLSFKNHHLVLEEAKNSVHTPTPSINTLFKNLALYKQQNSVAILLSGTGDDGTQGMRAIKEHGGITIVQSLSEAQYTSMPKSAIDEGVVDEVFTVEEMATYLTQLLLTSNSKEKEPMELIQKILRDQKHLDLHKYKKETIIRRINKRMMFLHISSIKEYANYLFENQNEAHLLYQEILIGVTAFFRDQEAFNALEKTLTVYLEKKPENYELRIWCIACATGEEAYSLAILVDKILKRLNKNLDVRIFATDIDDNALAKARGGEYSKESLKEMDEKLRNEYFIPLGNNYKVIQSLRQKIVFTHHDLLQDPPFINQDFISCRNLLIYLLPVAQKETFSLFHYALNVNGILFLGSSESTLLSVNYFNSINLQYKIYEKEYLQNPPKISNHYFSKHLDQKPGKLPLRIAEMDTTTIEERIEHTIFDFFAPNCVIVDQNFSMVYKKGDIPFIRFSDGFPSLNLLSNLDESLRYDVKTLISRTFDAKKLEFTKFIETDISSSDKTFVRVVAYPFDELNSAPMVLLYFQRLNSNDLQFNLGTLPLPNESDMLKNLTAQLSSTREEIRLLSDELSLSKEKMQVVNEELQSSNEELQSSNEELETSNEELQSSNEELHSSLTHIEKLQQELALILNSSFDGIIGLDKNGRHTFVNTTAAAMLGYAPDELIGKASHPLWHHTKSDGTPYPEEECPIKRTLKNGEAIRVEETFWKKDGTSFEVELLQSPIMQGGEIIGAVIAFHDIAEENRLEKLALHEHQLAELYVNIPRMLVMTLDTNANITMINNEGCTILGIEHEKIIGTNWIDTFIISEEREKAKEVFLSSILGKTPIVSHNSTIIDSSGQNHFLVWTNAFMQDSKGNITGMISSGIDASDMKIKDDIMISQARQAAMGDMLAMIAHQWRQPLSVISMASNTLKAHLELEEEITPATLKHLIDTMNEQTHYLSHTIDDFRNFFKPDKGKETVSTSIILDKLMTLIQKGIENNNITLTLPENQAFDLLTYPNQLLQALINIINNAKDAIKEHNPDNGVIRITLEQKNAEIIIGICDNGGGIDPSIKGKLAQPYVTTKAENGTGLGLYMSTIIVSKHLGGKLWWTSDKVGSCFYISLPMKTP